MNWTLTLIDLIEKLTNDDDSMCNLLMFTTQVYTDTFSSILFKGHGTKKIYFETGNEKLNNVILNFKSNTFTILIKLQSLTEYENNKSYKPTFISNMSTMIPEVISEVASLQNLPDFREVIEDENVKTTFAKACKFLTTFLKFSDYFSIFE